MKKILGISAFYHDSAAALIIGGKTYAAAKEERFTRIKNTPVFPVNAIKYCLEESGLSIDELDAIVFYDKPFLKFERLLQTYYAFAPKGVRSFLKSIPVWLNEKLFLKRKIYEGLKEVEPYCKKEINLLFTEHHLSHAASSFLTSPFKESAILTIDGVGEWCTASIAHGTNGNIKILKELEFPHSVGLLYSSFTYFLGFTVNLGEYKLMGLAPYGNPKATETLDFIAKIKKTLVDIKEDGSIWLDQSYFNYCTGLTMINESKWTNLFNINRKKPSDSISKTHCNLAYAIQNVTEEIVLKMAQEALKLTNSNNLCLAGGVTLNCVANGKLLEKEIFNNVYVQPAADDSGGAIGAALAISTMYFNEDRVFQDNDTMNGTYLGPSYSDKEIDTMTLRAKGVSHKYDNFDELTSFIATKINNGNVIGWFQGRMEFGPRALGNRSILGDATNPDMQKKINLSIKNRESFRPFAPSVLEEDYSNYFKLKKPSPYMTFVTQVNDNRRSKQPEDIFNSNLIGILNSKRSNIQSVTHIDFTARVQTVNKKDNERYWALINAYKGITGESLIINTSFNVSNEPIVCSPYDAYRCFMLTEMDYLVLNNNIYCKTEQPMSDRTKWISKTLG